MKRFLNLMLVAVMAIGMAACNLSVEPAIQAPVEDSVSYMVWQPIDSVTSHINLSDSACITMTIEDSLVVFETQGIENFKVFTDTVEVPISRDSNIYYLQIVDIEGQSAKIQADSTELEF